MKLDVRKFKKISADKTHTIMRNDEGHEIKIAHAALSPKVRSQLAEIPASGPKPVKMADGGEVDKKDKGPKIDPKKAADFEKGFNDPNAPVVENIKKAGSAIKSALGFADGGEVDQQADPAPQAQAPTPININIGGGGQGFSPVPAAAQPMAQAPQMPEEGSQPYGTGGEQPYGAPAGTPMPAAAPSAPIEPQAAPQAAPASMPQAQGQGLAQQAPQQDTFGTQATQESALRGLGEQRAGILGQATAQQQQAKAEVNAFQDAAKQQMDAQKLYQDHYSQLDQERQALQNDLQNGHIDPNHVWNSKSTVGKVGTIIGMLLSGLGSGATGQENMAVKMLNDQISRDMEAQKAELDKKNSLLSANFKQFGNLKDATDMTRIMMNDAVTSKLKLAAAQAASPMAKAAALQAVGKLDYDSADRQGQMAMRKSLLTGMKSGAVQPEKIVNFFIPEAQRPAANKELEEARNTVAARDNVVSAIDQLAKLNTVGNALTSPVQTSKQVAAIKQPLVAALSKATAGRFTEQDASFLDSLFPAKGDNDQTIATKRAQAIKLINEKMHYPILESYGINMGDSGRFSPNGGSKIPESKPIIKR